MPIVLFLVFIAVPMIELALIIKVGQTLGFWMTLALMIGMAIAGTAMLNRQGIGVMKKAAEALAEGRPPVAAVIDSVFLFVAGLLLVTPGFLSDILGLLLLIPPVRRWIASAAFRHMTKTGQVRVRTYQRGRWTETGPDGPSRPTHPPAEIVIETDYERLDETTKGDPPRTN